MVPAPTFQVIPNPESYFKTAKWQILGKHSRNTACLIKAFVILRDNMQLWSRKDFIPDPLSVLRIRGVCPGSRFLNFIIPGSWITDPGPDISKKRKGKNLLSYLFCSHKYHKIVNYFIIWTGKNLVCQCTKSFKQIVTKLSKIWVSDPGSGKTFSGSRIQG